LLISWLIRKKYRIIIFKLDEKELLDTH